MKEFVRFKFNFEDESKCLKFINEYVQIVSELAEHIFLEKNPNESIPKNFKPKFEIKKLDDEYVVYKG